MDLKADPQRSTSVPIRGPGTLADFPSLVLEPDGVPEAKRYLGAHAGDTIHLSAEEIPAFNAPDGNDQSRVSTDQVDGFTSSMKKGIGRSVMAKQLTDIFQHSCDSFQQRRSESRSQRRGQET